MDIAGSPYDRMLGSLRRTFNGRLPGGLTDPADKRLQRTLDHYIKEIIRVQGVMNDQEIMRETFDSMAGWFRRNTAALTPISATPKPPVGASPLVMLSPMPAPSETEDPLVLFERLKATRGGGSAVAPAPTSLPTLPELTAIETRPKQPIVGVPATMMSTPLDSLRAPFPPSQSMDFLQRQEDVVKYREVEYNIVLNSKDRNWYKNVSENRYNFSVQLNSGTSPQGRGYQLTLMNRIKNIVRLEFIKAIIPVEGLEVVVPRACDPSGTDPTPAAGFVSVLSLPFVHVLLDEHTGNNIGTSDLVDRSLAICQYDATWKSDQTHDPTHNRGYTLFFPKFMKAQRTFSPTPLGSLQNLHFQLINPEGLIVSETPDSYGIVRILFSNAPDVSGSCYYDPATGGNAEYLFVQTADYFPMWAFSKYDRLSFAGISAPTTPPPEGFDEMIRWLQRDSGHIVVGIAHGTTGSVTMDANDCGYANWIVLRNRFTSPITGNCSRDYFTGDLTTEGILANTLNSSTDPFILYAGATLNLSRQVQLFLRVVTREMDSGSNMRPDNV